MTPEDDALLEQLAGRIVQLHMAAPAILFLESGKPLAFLGSQALVFAEPMVRSFFSAPRYADVTRLLEDRANIECLIQKIERHEADRVARERDARRRTV